MISVQMDLHTEVPMEHQVSRLHDFGDFNVKSWVEGLNGCRIALYQEGVRFRVGLFKDNKLVMSTPCDSYEDAQNLLLIREEAVKLRRAQNAASSRVDQGDSTAS